MRAFGLVFTTFWTDPGVRALSEKGRTLYLYLLSSPHSNGLGMYRCPVKYIEADLDWSGKDVNGALDELRKSRFVDYCHETGYALIYGFLKWNRISNPNMSRARVKEAETIPRECSIFPQFIDHLLQFGSTGEYSDYPIHKPLLTWASKMKSRIAAGKAAAFQESGTKPAPVAADGSTAGKRADEADAPRQRDLLREDTEETAPRQGSGDGEPAARQDKAKRAAADNKDGRQKQPTLSQLVWEAYESAFIERYQVPPVRNAKVNSQIKSFVGRIPKDDQVEVTKFYLRSNEKRFVSCRHSFGTLLQCAEQVHADWSRRQKGVHIVSAPPSSQYDDDDPNNSPWRKIRETTMSGRGKLHPVGMAAAGGSVIDGEYVTEA